MSWLFFFNSPHSVNTLICFRFSPLALSGGNFSACLLMYVCSFGLAADQKRSRFKEGGRSMNSTGSGKSSTVSRSVHLVSFRSDSRRFLQELTQWSKVEGGGDTESCYTTFRLSDTADNSFIFPLQKLQRLRHKEKWVFTKGFKVNDKARHE